MDTWGLRVLVLLLLFLTGFYGEKILSEMKRCGDPECESLMIRAQASRDYNGPDCRYLNFKTGEEILVYYKLSGKRDDLWQGSQGKESGYFPKDAVKIEEVYISEEVEIPAKETDFICLDGGEYIFENEDSVLHNGNQEIDYLDPDSDSYLKIPEGKIGKPTSVSYEMEDRINTIQDTNVHEIELEKPQTLVATTKDGEQESLDQRLVATTKDGEQESLDQRLVATTKDGEQEPLDHIDGSESTNDDVVPQETIKSAWTVSGIAGWLGIGGKQEEKVVNTIVQPLQENSFHSRKIALSDEINPEQVDDEQKPEHVKSGWFDIGFREYLPFGRKESDHPLEEIDTDIQSQDNTMVVDSTKYIVPLETGSPTEEQEKQTRDSEVLKSNWFNLDLDNVINFGQILKENIYIKETEEKTDKRDSDEPKQSLNSLGEKCNADHEEKLKRGGSGVDQKQNDEINTILKENPDLDQNTISKETNASREYQPQISDNKHPKSGWFNLGLDTILNVDENNEDITLTAEQTEERSDGSDSKEETQVLTPGEKDFGTDSEETYRKGETDNDETDKHLKEFRHSENNPPTSGWFSNHFENLLNLKIASATEESPLPMEVNDKEQATELYNTKTSLESQLMERAEELLKQAESIKNEPGDVTEKAGHEKKTFEKEYSEQQNQQSEKLNINMYEEEAENTYDSTQQVFTDAVNAGQLHKQDKNTHTGVGNTQLDAQQTEAHSVSSVNVQEGEYVSFANSEGNGKEFLSEISFQFPNQIPSDKTKLAFEILAYLNAQDIRSNANSLWSTLTDVINKAVDSLPEDLRPGPDLYGVSWEMVLCGALIGLFTFFLFLCRASKVIRSRHYIGREKQLACKVEELMENKCKELEKLSTYKKQYEELELSLKDASFLKESSETTCLEATCEKLNQSNSALSDEIGKIEKELEEEKSRRLQQDDFFDDIQRRVESLEKEAKALKSQADEARTTLKVFQINEGRLKTALQDAKEEQIRFQERNEQLLQEADGWEERLSELAEQKNMFEFSKRDMEEALNNKESQVKSLTECLLTMKDWTMELGEENNLEVNSWEEDVTDETENGEHLDDPQKRTVKKLIYAAKLNASLKTLEAERNQIYIKLSDEVKAKEELADRIDQLQKEQNSLHSENSHFETDVHKLQQKLKVMTEMYQENELKLHRKLTVEERDRLQKEEKLSKVDEKIYHAAEELHSYKTRAKDLEEELEKTIRSYQSQITCHEKKGHDNWLSARAAERHLNDVKKENAHSRQKLTELEFKLELIEKDPYALDVPRVFGRENSPYGPSPLGRPSPETRAFNSPPTLMEGPLRLSPMFPGGERGSRGPEDHAEYSTPNERADSDRVSDHQGAHSDTGSLSPPWERDRRINIHASGQYCHDPAVHPRRQERYYHNPPISGRFSGPAELLRSYNMHSFEKTDGNVLAENSLVNESSGNGSNDNLSNVLNVADHSLPPNNEAVVGSSFAPPPPQMRGPLMPMDPRGPFMRRVSPFPPPVIDVYGPRDYLPVHDFSGLLRHPMGMRNPFPTRPFLPFPHQKAGFYPSPPSPQSRNDPTPAQTHPSGVTDAEHQEPHQDT